VSYWTYQDNIDHVVGRWAAAQSGSVVEKQYARAATQDALREIGNRYSFSYYLKEDRINTVSPYDTGTVTYTTSNRYMTLTGGTWPSWAGQGTVLVNRYPYKVLSRVSDTQLLMDPDMSPQDDVTVVGMSYQLFQDTYTLFADLVSLDKLYSMSNNWVLSYVPQQKWLEYSRYWRQPSTVRCWTITGDERNPGRLAMKLNWAPSTAGPFDFFYRRRPRELKITSVSGGNVAVTGTAVTGTGTAFTSAMVGSVFRLGTATDAPTGNEGESPYQSEALITAVASTTALTLNVAPGDVSSGTKYVISDPIDIEVGSMLNMFKACSEYHHARMTHKRDVDAVRSAYELELRIAMGADARYAGTEAAGTNQTGLWTGLAAGVPLPWLRSDQ